MQPYPPRGAQHNHAASGSGAFHRKAQFPALRGPGNFDFEQDPAVAGLGDLTQELSGRSLRGPYQSCVFDAGVSAVSRRPKASCKEAAGAEATRQAALKAGVEVFCAFSSNTPVAEQQQTVHWPASFSAFSTVETAECHVWIFAPIREASGDCLVEK
jgi:hypothetical protein